MDRRIVIASLAASMFLLGFATFTQAAMSSASFRITSSVLSGGGGYAESTNFHLYSTIGQSSFPGSSASSTFSLDSGFWYTLLQTIMGDVNGDGEVNVVDAITALQVLTNQSPEQVMKGADVNGDGVIGLGETIMILRKQSN